MTLKRHLAVLRRPVFLVVVNFFLVNTLFSLLPFSLGNIVYNTGRVSIMLYAGWLIANMRVGGVWQSGLAGVFIYFVDHVCVKGGVFLLNYLFKTESPGLAAFGGVLASFILFIPLAMLIGSVGGFLARVRQQRAPGRD